MAIWKVYVYIYTTHPNLYTYIYRAHFVVPRYSDHGGVYLPEPFRRGYTTPSRGMDPVPPLLPLTTSRGGETGPSPPRPRVTSRGLGSRPSAASMAGDDVVPGLNRPMAASRRPLNVHTPRFPLRRGSWAPSALLRAMDVGGGRRGKAPWPSQGGGGRGVPAAFASAPWVPGGGGGVRGRSPWGRPWGRSRRRGWAVSMARFAPMDPGALVPQGPEGPFEAPVERPRPGPERRARAP